MPLPEKLLIRRLRRLAGEGTAVVRGIGDDCAVLRIPRGHEALVTTDFSLEGVHFRREWHPPESVGHRCLARGLSDIAAMGGTPQAAFLSLALPEDLPQRWVDSFFRGFLRLAKRFSVPLAGGDTAGSLGGIFADVVVVGSIPRGSAVLRSGAKPGDRIYVTGSLGSAAASLDQMFAHPKRKLDPKLHSKHFFPMPRLAAGQYLRKRGLISAMIDISDGLSTDLSHICQESGVGAELEAEAIPRGTLDERPVDLSFALHGGDDYELIFTARDGVHLPARIAGVPVTCIGWIVKKKKMLLRSGMKVSELEAGGWQHFERKTK